MIGKGIYPIPMAARISRIPGRSLRNWIVGYKYPGNGEQRYAPPVLEPDFEPMRERQGRTRNAGADRAPGEGGLKDPEAELLGLRDALRRESS